MLLGPDRNPPAPPAPSPNALSALCSATPSGKIILHAPHDTAHPIRTLNLQKKITGLLAGPMEGGHDVLYVGSPTDLLAYDVENNKDMYVLRCTPHRMATHVAPPITPAFSPRAARIDAPDLTGSTGFPFAELVAKLGSRQTVRWCVRVADSHSRDVYSERGVGLSRRGDLYTMGFGPLTRSCTVSRRLYIGAEGWLLSHPPNVSGLR